MSDTGVKTLQYTSDPAVEHIAWEETGDGVVLTILPVPMSGASLGLNLVVSVGALIFVAWSDIRWEHWLPFSILFAALAVDSVLRFRRSRMPIYVRVEGGRLKVTGAGLLKTHDWALGEIQKVRAPITGFAWSGPVLSAIEVTPVKEARVQLAGGRRLEEMEWAVRKLPAAMAAAGWPGAGRKSRARRLGEWLGRVWRRN